MSRVVLINVPAHGHINPTLGVVQELVRRGEQVIYYATDPFRPAIEAVGAQFRSYSAEIGTLPQRISPSPVEVGALTLALTKALMPRLVADLRADPPDYIIHDGICPAGKMIALVLRVPAVASFPLFVFSARVVFSSPRLLLGVMGEIRRHLPDIARAGWLARRLRREYDVGWPWTQCVFNNHEPLNLVYTSREFHPFGDRVPGRYVFVGPCLSPRIGIEELPLDATKGKRVILVSMGTVTRGCEDFFRTCFEALGSMNATVVLATGQNGDPRSYAAIPANFVVRQQVPQLEVLEKTDVFVTHGGMNSVHEAMVNHVPVVVVPQTIEQAVVGQQVQKFGVGVWLKTSKPSAKTLRDAVQDVLEKQEYREKARALGLSFVAAGGAPKAVEEIFRFKRAAGIA